MNNTLKGLVLAGGKSTRMGRSKANICWHKKEQQYHLADLLGLYCDEVFISCRQDQQVSIHPDYKLIPDLDELSGPVEAIAAAFKKYPDCGWMVIACDVPLLDAQTLNCLVEERDILKIATVFGNPLDGLPEPLVAIWEAKGFELFQSSNQEKKVSLRKILIGNGAKIIKAPNNDALINANTPADAARIEAILQHSAFFIR